LHLSRSLHKLLGILLVVVLCASLSAASNVKHNSRASAHKRTTGTKVVKPSRHSAKSPRRTATRSSRKSSKSVARRPRGQQGIQSDRAREIQAALIREKYLDGEPNGVWDARTRDAMTRFQGDNGWQTKVIPDSRALIKLGLGPNHANLINPESIGGANLPEAIRDTRPGGGTPQR
jgi:peptidoglycan hydrolase-like protein with peptidoglycan-binding domain